MKIRTSQSGNAAFTIVEIAIALGIIGFALVAIVGILPTGLNVEKENREETLINQDGPYFLEAVRSGARGLGILTNFVDSVTVSNSVTGRIIYTNSPNGVPAGFNGNMVNSEWIIGLMSTPKYFPHPLGTNSVASTNRVDVRVRALSGSAVEQNNKSKDITFGYSIYAEVVPMNFHAFQGNPAGLVSPDDFSRNLQANLYEVRLNFRWPLLPNGDVGGGRKIYRTYVSGQLVSTNAPDGTTLYLFHPDTFAKLQ